MRFTYQLTGTGWSSATVGDATTQATVTASYLSDALGELLRALVGLTDGATTARCSWAQEPGEYRWIFTRDADMVSLRILAFADLWGDAPDEAGEELFRTSQHLRQVVQAVVEGASGVLAEHGETGYKEAWVQHEFPAESLAQLRRWLSATV